MPVSSRTSCLCGDRDLLPPAECQFILYGPENLSLPLINYLFQQGMRIPLDHLREKPEKEEKKREKEKKASKEKGRS